MNLKARLFGIILIGVFAYLTYINWQQLQTEAKYSLKIAAFGPLGVIGGLFMAAFPRYIGKPSTTKERVVVLLVFTGGLAAGLMNWYLMDPGFFGR